LTSLGLSGNPKLGDLNKVFNRVTGSVSAKIIDSNWNWTADENMTIKRDTSNEIIITVWN